jgi:hypothetical protein
MPEHVMREVERTLREIIERHTERRLRTPDLLARLRIDHRFPVPPYQPSPVMIPPTAPASQHDLHDGPSMPPAPQADAEGPTAAPAAKAGISAAAPGGPADEPARS